MITNERQYQRLLHEQFKAAAPALWSILNYPFESVVSGPCLKMPTAKQQQRAMRELARMTRMPIPKQLFLEEEP
jgi:hypothetical protein